MWNLTILFNGDVTMRTGDRGRETRSNGRYSSGRLVFDRQSLLSGKQGLRHPDPCAQVTGGILWTCGGIPAGLRAGIRQG